MSTRRRIEKEKSEKVETKTENRLEVVCFFSIFATSSITEANNA
jgi:hypothetical protein